ncbi:MAG: hypothetical protein ACTSQY_10470 [Candidatus Odinarchaeia archaeon]
MLLITKPTINGTNWNTINVDRISSGFMDTPFNGRTSDAVIGTVTTAAAAKIKKRIR